MKARTVEEKIGTDIPTHHHPQSSLYTPHLIIILFIPIYLYLLLHLTTATTSKNIINDNDDGDDDDDIVPISEADLGSSSTVIGKTRLYFFFFCDF